MGRNQKALARRLMFGSTCDVSHKMRNRMTPKLQTTAEFKRHLYTVANTDLTHVY